MHKILASNRKANYQYSIEETFEAGLVLQGSEVKSIRANKITIDDAFISSYRGELYIINAHIAKYDEASINNHKENRRRKILLHKKQINKIMGKINKAGFTAVILKIYLNDSNVIKAEIALAKGKKNFDKRRTVKDREWNIEKSRLLKSI